MRKIAVTKLACIWKDHRISKGTEMKVAKTLIFPIVITSLSPGHWKRSTENKWTPSRYLHGDACSESHGRMNESILKELGITERLNEIVQKSILKYFGHIMRKNKDSRKTSHAGEDRRKETQRVIIDMPIKLSNWWGSLYTNDGKQTGIARKNPTNIRCHALSRYQIWAVRLIVRRSI